MEKRARSHFPLVSHRNQKPDQFTVKNCHHTRAHTRIVHSLPAPGTLEHLHHLRAPGVMATVSMTTAEKRDDGDETAGRSDEELGAKARSTGTDPTCDP